MNYHIGRLVLSSLCVRAFGTAGFWWCSFCRLKLHLQELVTVLMNYHIGRLVLSSLCVGAFGVAGIWWCSLCRLKPAKRTPSTTSRTKSSNTQRTENKTTNMVIHQHSRKLLKMDILMSETCWAHNKWTKIASDIKLVFHSSTVTYIQSLHHSAYFCVLLLDTPANCN